MNFEDLLGVVASEPLFDSSILLCGVVDEHGVRQQLTRWTKSGKLIQLRRGLYALAEPYRKLNPHPFEVANQFTRPSYVSLESALRYYDIIPEAVPTTTSVTTGRPATTSTPLGAHVYRHVDESRFWGYEHLVVRAERRAWVATPEKALLDLAHLVPAGDTSAFIESLRLQNLDQLDLTRLDEFVERWDRPKLHRAARAIRQHVEEAREYETL